MGAIKRRTGEADLLVTNVDRAAQLLGWRPSIDWRAGVKTLRDDPDERDANKDSVRAR
jgi:hypothetical protein